MNKEELYSRLDELSWTDSILDALDASQWRFWRKKKQLNEAQMFPLVREYIELRSKKSEIKMRENAYELLGKLLRRTMIPEYCQYLIDCLAKETNKYVLHTILSCLKRLQLPSEMNIANIVRCSRHDAWQVRHNAIMALGSSDTEISREAARYWVKQEDEKLYKFEMIYAQGVLGHIGEASDIELLERHINSRIRDVKDSASFAINHIRKRFGADYIGREYRGKEKEWAHQGATII